VALLLLVSAGAASARTPDPLERYAEGTWASFVAMTDERTGLPADFVQADGTRSTPTSPTNIGAYLWSAAVAERLRIIGHAETVARLDRTLTTLERMERGDAGQYFNWYDIRTGALSPTSPGGDTVTPWLSSVDNGWLAVGLRIVASRVPELRTRAQRLFDSMDFGFYYRPERNQILFHYTPGSGDAPCCYDTIVSESRIATTSGSRRASCRRGTTTARSARSPTTAASRRSPSASRAPTSASRSSRARSRTRACASRRRGAGACSRR
jgi:uncharacterized protein DUF3131